MLLRLTRRADNHIPIGDVDEHGPGITSAGILSRDTHPFFHQYFLYHCRVSLSDIAGTADIGERECLRCFQKTIQLSPIQYLIKYRIMQGAEMLLCEPESSISEIAISCGFDSPSNFARIFKRFYDCTPREYRKNSLQTAE